MAKIIKNHKRIRKGGRPQIHPWNTWFDGQTRRLVQGEDFTGSSLRAMEVLIRRTALKRGFAVTMEVDYTEKSIILGPKPAATAASA